MIILALDVQKGRTARRQQAKGRGVRRFVRQAPKRRENKADGPFQHPANWLLT
jgi:hypothetical protein